MGHHFLIFSDEKAEALCGHHPFSCCRCRNQDSPIYDVAFFLTSKNFILKCGAKHGLKIRIWGGVSFVAEKNQAMLEAIYLSKR